VGSLAFDAAGSRLGEELLGMFAGLFAASCLPLIFFAIILRLVSR